MTVLIGICNIYTELYQLKENEKAGSISMFKGEGSHKTKMKNKIVPERFKW